MVKAKKDDFGKRKRNRNRTIKLIILLVLYIILQVMVIAWGRRDSLGDSMLGFMPINSAQGILNSIQVLIAVSMVIVDVRGFYLGFGLLSTSGIFVIIRMIIIKNPSPVPGLCILVCGIVMVNLIHGYLVKLKDNEKEINDMSLTDALTDLPNRRALKQHMNRLVKDAHYNNKIFAIVMIDIDNFKNVNDTIGHEYGDQVLYEISQRWKKVLDAGDYLARLGGDEFAVVVDDVISLEELDQHLKLLMQAANEKFSYGNREFFLSASMGVSVYLSDSTDPSLLLKYADLAMFAAKNQGKKKVCYYDSLMNEKVQNNVKMDSIVRKAIADNRLRVLYQPQYVASSKKIRGFEALVRLIDEDGNMISPGDFIPIAEKSTLIIDVDNYVLEQALTDFKKMIAIQDDVIVCVNISAIHMLDEHFLESIDKALEKTGFPTKNLEIELTESVFVDSMDRAIAIMQKLKDRGIGLAIDDFGTGYSSLSYLRDLPVNLLKIDKAFVDTLTQSDKDAAFVEAIISMGRILQFNIISEGVETKEQLDILDDMGCDYIQGFYKGKPMPLEDAEKILR